MHSNYPLDATFGPTFLPTIKGSLYSPSPPTPRNTARPSSSPLMPYLAAHFGSSAQTSNVTMTSVYSTIVTNDFIHLSSLHHYDTFMTSRPGLSFWTLSDMFWTYL